mmetsp:Transcript_1078/g.2028  ORF Transcript_1078/g.2028 Transcript_1078/m.2028 type:complete len:221 (-) Transcript_1078:603-1265(-)
MRPNQLAYSLAGCLLLLGGLAWCRTSNSRLSSSIRRAPSTVVRRVVQRTPQTSLANAPLYAVPLPPETSLRRVIELGNTPGLRVQCKADDSAEEATKKYGLEFGLWKAFKSGSGQDAKSLLKKYGSAYLATSISLAAVSFGICYVLVDNGVDVTSLLNKIGIESSGATTKAGTAAIAYAAHKAASPIRFPPTVALTPIVAEKLFGQKTKDAEDSDLGQQQ